jgi:RNA polymerase sigma-70 factor (ECF subfamily)
MSDEMPATGEADFSFAEFLGRIRADGESAAVELARHYEPALRTEIHVGLRDPRLLRLLEPADLRQSVLKSFFVRAALGQFDLDSPERLLAPCFAPWRATRSPRRCASTGHGGETWTAP